MSTVILHILPEDGIGGAELAANSAAMSVENVHVLYLSRSQTVTRPSHPSITYGAGSNLFGRAAIMSVLKTYDRVKPDVVVVSLWKSFGAFAFLKLMRRNSRFALFLHSDRRVHFLDRLLTWQMARWANCVWSDSQASLQHVRRSNPGLRSRVISFLIHEPRGVVRYEPQPSFIYWGRLTPLKNIPAALEFFSKVVALWPEATFTLIGPDGGCLADLRERVKKLGLGERVTFVGLRNYEDIVALAAKAKFFLQLSIQEGMAMSVVEAMQLGLVPIVTPVGEIANYCRDMENGLIHMGDEACMEKLEKVMGDPGLYAELSAAAVEEWQGAPTYARDFVAAGQELVARSR